MESIQERLYTPKEVSELLGISGDLLRMWVIEFNIVTEWTKPNGKGHRRFTKQNVELLLTIREKIQHQQWGYDQVRSFLNGETDSFVELEQQSRLEDKMDQIMEGQKDFQQDQLEFNRLLMQKLDSLTNELVSTKEKLEKAESELIQSRREQEEMKMYLDERLERRDQLLLETVRNQQEEQQNEKTKTGFFRRLFG